MLLRSFLVVFFFFKQKTAYDMRISDWSSDVCSSDLPHVRLTDLAEVWETLEASGLGTPNVGLVSDIIACPGLDYCNLANARSIPVAQRITQRFGDLQRQHEIGDLKIKISGCINACGHHHVGHIGLLGVDKRGEEDRKSTRLNSSH